VGQAPFPFLELRSRQRIVAWNASAQPRFIPPNLKEISDADSFMASRRADSSDRAPIRSQRHLVADGMAKPLDEQTDGIFEV
jgi:hypothetical protein